MLFVKEAPLVGEAKWGVMQRGRLGGIPKSGRWNWFPGRSPKHGNFGGRL
jgi:hypothetical protein